MTRKSLQDKKIVYGAAPMSDPILSHTLAIIVDVRVDQKENCFPMIPSGKAHNEMILSADAEKFDKTLV